ncbi:bacteriocin immunity protein [Lactiplantibacillus modestisalitolerans]|uniref:Bacteriocin immunity protein n=1 Tax=Lactiplantibacillus modestisalitolerans TaxID=1457219 RepID=A0ABV5WWH4_9LACO|nr:bacteriocin immunity protein [Lactiplantibacillus modestisalitolerans]
MAKADFWVSQQQKTQLKTQLILTRNDQAIRSDVGLNRLVLRAGQRLAQQEDYLVVARHLVVDLGYYLFCHDYQMPRAAHDLLAIACQIDIGQPTGGPVIQLSEIKAEGDYQFGR